MLTNGPGTDVDWLHYKGSGIMREWIVRCPRTGLPVQTGMASTETSLRTMRVRGIINACPACGRTHEWLSEDAWLVAAPENDQPDAVPEIV